MSRLAFRRTLAAALVGSLALALSGCVRLGVELELKPDDVARPSVVVAVEDEALDATGQSAADFIDRLVSGQDPADGAVRTEEYARDGYTGERYVYAEQGIGGIAAAVNQPVNVVREGDEYVVSGVLDLSAEALGVAGQGSLDNLDVTIDISFPGAVTESNGTISGNAVHWEPPLGGEYEIRARGSALDPSSPEPSPAPAADGAGTTSGVPDWLVPVLGIGGLVILLLLGIVVWQALRVRRRDDAGPGGPPPYQQAPPAPQPPGHPGPPRGPHDPNRPPSIPPQP